MGFSAGNSSPKRNRLDQCLLGSKESQKVLIFEADFWLKVLIIKAFGEFYTASQALMPNLGGDPFVERRTAYLPLLEIGVVCGLKKWRNAMFRIILALITLCLAVVAIWFLVNIKNIGGGVDQCMKLEGLDRDKCMDDVRANAKPVEVAGKVVTGQN